MHYHVIIVSILPNYPLQLCHTIVVISKDSKLPIYKVILEMQLVARMKLNFQVIVDMMSNKKLKLTR